MKHTLTITIAALLVYSAAGFATQQTTPGFTNPESAVWDAQANAWYVSNMPDGPTGQKGTGFLAKLNAKGAVEQLQWVKGLNAPKGLALSQGQIFVADVDHVAVVDINTAT